MVADTTTAQRVDIELESLRLMLLDLPEFAADWERLADGERTSWCLDWDQLMGALQIVLCPAHRSGVLSPDQQLRYHAVCRQLQQAMPTIRKLNLRPAPGPLIDEEAAP